MPSHDFRREYLARLPLPMAQLYCRAHNAKDGRARHDNCFYLFEALVKMAGCPLVAAYVDELKHDGEHVEALDRLLVQLSLPSLGQWVGILRETARYFGEREDAETHPVGGLWKQLNEKRKDLTGALELFRRIKNGPEGKPAGDKSCSIIQLIDALVQYRNAVFGHGASRSATFYEEQMGPLMFPAVNDLLAEGVLDLLGRSGSRLVLLTEIKSNGNGKADVQLRELIGLQSERAAPIAVDKEFAANMLADRLALIWPGQPAPMLLDPLLAYVESETTEDVLFLNRDCNGKQVEYLSYTTGSTQRDKSMAPIMTAFLNLVSAQQMTEKRLEGQITKSERSQAGRQTVVDLQFVVPEPALLKPEEIRLKLLEPLEDGSLLQWLFTTEDTIQIGRDANNNARLDNPRVSRRHAVISHDGRQWQYENLGSNGTLHNGENVEQFTVGNGDVIQLAVTGPRIQFELP